MPFAVFQTLILVWGSDLNGWKKHASKYRLARNPHGTNAATPATASLDAHDIANCIMRQANYLIALFNKDLLDLRMPPSPKLKQILRQSDDGKGRTLTRLLEWNLRSCLMELRRRLIFMGILNAIFAPFIFLYMIMFSFFRYFEEYHKNPSSIGGRRYTPFAQWKFREFNELSHLFTRRLLDESHPLASMYIGQFPNEKIVSVLTTPFILWFRYRGLFP
ncbi:autophagy protein Apg9-domain-containing protein [Suillus variegatus]|nr:autophagy protein Apg9-domain-containing protein [Suillus variegatus]